MEGKKGKVEAKKLPYSVMTGIFISKIHIHIPLWVIESEHMLLGIWGQCFSIPQIFPFPLIK